MQYTALVIRLCVYIFIIGFIFFFLHIKLLLCIQKTRMYEVNLVYPCKYYRIALTCCVAHECIFQMDVFLCGS